ncbi:MAG: hypothetical protein IM600_12235 [Bacteroidetes bacterium]|nr:hypothetical protein [Bacteroidota bacterium]MCA6444190.1 hypothetical protein [Bacteroidota bacterium]
MIIIIGYNSISQTNKKTYYDEYLKTTLKEEFQVNGNGEKNGWYKKYANDGISLIVKAIFLNGRLNGTYESFVFISGRQYPNEVINYKDGILNGQYKSYVLNDYNVILKQGNFKDDKMTGIWNLSIRTSNDNQGPYSYATGTTSCTDGNCSEVNKYYYSNKQIYREIIKADNYKKVITYYVNGKILSLKFYCANCQTINKKGEEESPDSLREFYNSGKLKLHMIGNDFKYEYRENGTIIKGEKPGFLESYDDKGNKTTEMIDFENTMKRLKENEEANKKYEENEIKRKMELDEKKKLENQKKLKFDSVKKNIEVIITDADNLAKNSDWKKSKNKLRIAYKMLIDTNNQKFDKQLTYPTYYFDSRKKEVISKIDFINKEIYKILEQKNYQYNDSLFSNDSLSAKDRKQLLTKSINYTISKRKQYYDSLSLKYIELKSKKDICLKGNQLINSLNIEFSESSDKISKGKEFISILIKLSNVIEDKESKELEKLIKKAPNIEEMKTILKN